MGNYHESAVGGRRSTEHDRYREDDHQGGRRYVVREGQLIEVETTDNPLVKPKRRRRDKFKVDFVKFPETWREALRGKPGTVYDLAHAIIVEAYKCEYLGGEVKLSAVRMPKATRADASKKLVELGRFSCNATVTNHIG